MPRLAPRLSLLLPALIAGLALPLSAGAQEMSDEEIKQLALQAILENPEVVMEAIQILREREAAEAQAQAQAVLEGSRESLEADPNAPVLGNPDGDVTLIEFFDYNCPYCKRAGEEVAKLLESDGNIRVVYREWPILGEGSVFAARAALAAREQDRYPEFHEALMTARGRLGETSVLKIAADLGLDIDKLRADMQSPDVQAHIDTSMQLAQSLGLTGTPGFVVGEEMAPGFLEAAQLQELVDAAREAEGG
ncbi:MAG: DsbA family protein [Pseudomonadota bacterium]